MKEDILNFIEGFVLFVIFCVVSGFNLSFGIESILTQNYFSAGCTLTALFGLLVGMAKFVWGLK